MIAFLKFIKTIDLPFYNFSKYNFILKRMQFMLSLKNFPLL